MTIKGGSKIQPIPYAITGIVDLSYGVGDVDGQDFATFDYCRAIHDNPVNVISGCGMDEELERIVDGRGCWRVGTHKYNIGLAARRETAKIGTTERIRTANRRHVKHVG